MNSVALRIASKPFQVFQRLECPGRQLDDSRMRTHLVVGWMAKERRPKRLAFGGGDACGSQLGGLYARCLYLARYTYCGKWETSVSDVVEGAVAHILGGPVLPALKSAAPMMTAYMRLRPVRDS